MAEAKVMGMTERQTGGSMATKYLGAVLFLATLAVIAILAVSLIRPTQDNTTLITAILSTVVPTIAAVLAFMKAQETHLSVNSRMDELLKRTSELSRVEGVAAGRVIGAAAANERTDVIAQKAAETPLQVHLASPLAIKVDLAPPVGEDAHKEKV